MAADGTVVREISAAEVKAGGPEAVAKSYNELVKAVKEGRIAEQKAVQELARLDAEVKRLAQERALSSMERPEIGSEAEMRQYISDDGRIVLRGHGHTRDALHVPGLLDDKPVCEWQRRMQELVEMRTLAAMRPGNGTGAAPTPRIDKLIERHIKVAPAPIRKALDDMQIVQRLFNGAAGAGSEWEQTLVLPRVEETMKVLAGMANFFEVVPMGSKTLELPFMTTGLRPYLKGAPSVDNPAYYTGSTVATTNRSFTAVGMSVLTQLLDDATEDSIIDTISFLREQCAQAIVDGEEDAIVNGDTTASHQDDIANWDIRSRWGSSGLGTTADHRRAWLGLRARAVDIGATAKLDGSSYTAFSGASGILSAMELKLHPGSMNGPTVYFSSPEHFIKVIKSDTNLLTLEKYGPQATIFTGEVGKVGMTRVHRSQYLSADMNTSGIYDNSTKTKTGSLLVDPRRYKIFRRRGLALETAKEIRNGVTYLVLTIREVFGTVDASGTVNVVYGYNLDKS